MLIDGVIVEADVHACKLAERLLKVGLQQSAHESGIFQIIQSGRDAEISAHSCFKITFRTLAAFGKCHNSAYPYIEPSLKTCAD